ncbi:MAG: DUF4303 domain-containing protein [Propionibacteriaceae bacterium]|nr:DUF4303 domain-containing protein [Propionibacteriaceae bacterium]
MLNLASLKRAAEKQMVRELRRVRTEYPQEHIYAGMFFLFYGDGGRLHWPCVAVGTKESLASLQEQYQARGSDGDPTTLRFSAADLPHMAEPTENEAQLAAQASDEAAALGSEDAWDEYYDRFVAVFPEAARAARRRAVAEGLIDEDCVVLALDEEMELLTASLTGEELARHFPELEEDRRRIAALPPRERVESVLDVLLRRVDGPVLSRPEGMGMLRTAPEIAATALLPVLNGDGVGFREAARIAAGLGEPTAQLIEVLDQVVADDNRDASDRAAAGGALSCLGRMDLVVQRVEELPDDVLAPALVAPYRFSNTFGTLNYRPLEAVFTAHPRTHDLVAAHPHLPCEIHAHELAEVERGAESSWGFIREHAAQVITELLDG